MTRQIAQLYRLLSTKARILLAVTAVLLVVERILLAAGAIGLTRAVLFTGGAGAAVVGLWALRGLLRQRVTTEARQKLIMLIAETALERGADGSFLPGEEADAAVFEGRYAAEQVLVVSLPALLAEPIALLVLLISVQPTGVPFAASAAAVGGGALAFALLRNSTVQRQKGAWRKFMTVAERALATIRAAPELIASGEEQAHLNRLRTSTEEWTRAVVRAERYAAVFQRIPVAVLFTLGAVLLVRAHSLHVDSAIRLVVFLPPLAGLTRTIFELLRTTPRIQMLAPVLGVELRATDPGGDALPPLPCEVRFESVNFAYGNVPVLRNVSFSWQPGEILAILGPNGSGKSTILKLMVGLIKPNSGRILVGGIDLRDLDVSAWRRNVAYLPQRPHVPEKFTVYQAMQFILPDLTHEEAELALIRTGSWDWLRRAHATNVAPLEIPVAVLSAGLRQRVMLSRTLARSKALVLLDEPDENLDAKSLASLGQLVHDAGHAAMVALATHDEGIVTKGATVVKLGDRAS